MRTETGRELITDSQRALDTVPPGRTSRKLVRVDTLKVGMQILCANEAKVSLQIDCQERLFDNWLHAANFSF